MDEQYTIFKDYTNRLIEKGKCLSNIGLWDGKMGVAIYLLHVSRITQNEKCESDASKLIDAVYEQISFDLPFSFDNGILGIGCGLEYIINQGFVTADSNEILSEIDFLARNIVDSHTINILSFSKGICGIGCYLYYRLKNRADNDDDITVLKLKEYLIYLIDWIEELIMKINDKKDYNDVYFLLVRLHKLKVFNSKIEKLLALCLHKMFDFNCQISDNYDLLGIPSLKVLKPWI